MQIPQEHFTTIVYAKFVGQTERIMGNLKIENKPTLTFVFSLKPKSLKDIHIFKFPYDKNTALTYTGICLLSTAILNGFLNKKPEVYCTL